MQQWTNTGFKTSIDLMKKHIAKPEEYDLLVLGSGEGGKYLAWSLAKRGEKVAVIERKFVGGSCPNIACLPSKNIIHSAKVASYFFRSAEFGITKENCKISMTAVRQRKRDMVTGLVEMHLTKFKESGAELIKGNGRFISPKTIEVKLNEGGIRVLKGKNVVINSGTRATLDPISGLAEAGPMTHIEALELDHIPEHLIVVGGGYVGLELAQAMRRLGSRVTIVERNDSLLHREDQDVVEEVQTFFHDEGIDFLINSKLVKVEGMSGHSVRVQLLQAGTEMTLSGTHILVAAGRTPNTDDLGLETAGVQLTARGHVKVDERLATTAPNVWAIGDCAGSPHFTHISLDDFRVVQENILGGSRTTKGRQVPSCLFTDPEFARVGLSEEEAKKLFLEYRLVKIPMVANLRTRTLSETRGFMKALLDVKSDRILGFCVVGIGAGEIMSAVQVAMIAELPYTALKNAIFTHPTLMEGLITLFSSTPTLVKPSKEAAK